MLTGRDCRIALLIRNDGHLAAAGSEILHLSILLNRNAELEPGKARLADLLIFRLRELLPLVQLAGHCEGRFQI